MTRFATNLKFNMMKKHYLFLITILCLGSFNVFAQDVDCDPLGCTDATACNYDVTATEDDGSCEFAQEDVDNPGFMLTCDGACQDDDGNDICDYNQVGCTDAESCNQSFFACIGDDGIASICPATIDDGSCTYAVLDFNCDGTCVDVDEDGICDKVDDLICANDSDNDGVCDDSAIEKGVGHVHPAFTEVPEEAISEGMAVFNRDMLDRSKDRSKARDLWKIGEPFDAVPRSAIELKPEGGGEDEWPLTGPTKWTDGSLIEAIASVILESMIKLELLPSDTSMKGGERKGGWMRVHLEGCNEKQSEMFCNALSCLLYTSPSPRD